MPKQISLTQSKAANFLKQMVGKCISRTWRGYASSIFFEIGELNEKNIGEFTFTADTKWTLCLGIDNCYSVEDLELEDIDALLEKLEHSKILDVQFNDNVLEVNLNNNRSLVIAEYKSDNWALQLNNKTFIIYKNGFIKEQSLSAA